MAVGGSLSNLLCIAHASHHSSQTFVGGFAHALEGTTVVQDVCFIAIIPHRRPTIVAFARIAYDITVSVAGQSQSLSNIVGVTEAP